MEELALAAKHYFGAGYEENKQQAYRSRESMEELYIRMAKISIRKCNACRAILAGFYFCCTQCDQFPDCYYSLCVKCFYDETVKHEEHDSFADNHSILTMVKKGSRNPPCVVLEKPKGKGLHQQPPVQIQQKKELNEGRGKQDSNRNSCGHSYSLRPSSSFKNSSRSNSFRRNPSFKNSSRSNSIVQVSSSKHLNPPNSIILASNFSERKITIDKEGIEKLARIAGAHYNAAPKKIKDSADNFFWSMVKERGKTTVSKEDFVESMKEMRFPEYAYPELFETVVKNRDMGMSIEESRTVYYIVVSGRPFCSWCDRFIPDVYFCCSKCSARSYALCLHCYSSKAYLKHEHYRDDDAFFLDYTVLHTTIKPTPKGSGSSSTAIVKRDPRPHDNVAAVLKIGTAILNAGAAVLTIASTLGASCTIM